MIPLVDDIKSITHSDLRSFTVNCKTGYWLIHLSIIDSFFYEQFNLTNSIRENSNMYIDIDSFLGWYWSDFIKTIHWLVDCDLVTMFFGWWFWIMSFLAIEFTKLGLIWFISFLPSLDCYRYSQVWSDSTWAKTVPTITVIFVASRHLIQLQDHHVSMSRSALLYIFTSYNFYCTHRVMQCNRMINLCGLMHTLLIPPNQIYKYWQ